jgi:hypothetical protein
VPIHPLLLLARRGGSGAARVQLPSSSRFLYNTPSRSARPSKNVAAKSKEGEEIKQQGSSKDAISASQTSSTKNKDSIDSKTSSPQPSVTFPRAKLTPPTTAPTAGPIKLTDKRGPVRDTPDTMAAKGTDSKEVPVAAKKESTAEGLQTGSSGPSSTSEGQVQGGVHKIAKGASLHPAAVEQDRRATKAAAATASVPLTPDENARSKAIAHGELQSSAVTTDEPGKVAEGIVVHHPPRSSSNAGTSSSQPASSASPRDPSQTASSSSTPLSGSESSRRDFVTSGQEVGSGSNEGEREGSRSQSMSQVPELGRVRPANPPHPFDTHSFIKRLQQANFVAKRVEDDGSLAPGEDPSAGTSLSSSKRHDPAEAIMEATRHLLISRGGRVIDHHISRTEVENQAYLFTAALSELRTELQVRARNDTAALRSMVTLLQREVDGLDQKMREDMAGMKHDIQVDMNNRKGEAKEEQNTLEQEIQDLNNRFTISISDLK